MFRYRTGLLLRPIMGNFHGAIPFTITRGEATLGCSMAPTPTLAKKKKNKKLGARKFGTTVQKNASEPQQGSHASASTSASASASASTKTSAKKKKGYPPPWLYLKWKREKAIKKNASEPQQEQQEQAPASASTTTSAKKKKKKKTKRGGKKEEAKGEKKAAKATETAEAKTAPSEITAKGSPSKFHKLYYHAISSLTTFSSSVATPPFPNTGRNRHDMKYGDRRSPFEFMYHAIVLRQLSSAN